ncbi:MAG TPA: hypothetical protein VG755_13430 [Nannocystaceae bacterium]|nr:hypothetical protein [Nannocystaceae bacterium]
MPSRPRLHDRVVVRRHLRAGKDELALFDSERERVLVLDARAWWVIGEADGTRDLPGIISSARRRGATWSDAQIQELFDELGREGLLADGTPSGFLGGEVTLPHRDDHREIVVMPGASYHCDGRGSCCRSYATIAFIPADVHRACATAPTRCNAGDDPSRVFLPLTGSAPSTIRAVTLADGSCAFLDADGACGLHRVGGSENKPVGCRWFPTQLVDDGTEIRASPAIECACPARPDERGAPLLPAHVRTAADLPAGIVIGRVWERVRVVDDVDADRADALAVLDAFGSAIDGRDLARAMWSWSLALLQHKALVPHTDDRDAPAIEPIAAWARMIAARASARAEAEALWRGERNLVCDRLRTIAAAAGVLGSPIAARALVEMAAPDPALEAHVVRSAVFGRAWLERGPLASRLAELALQLWIARALPAFLSEAADTTLREVPLAALLGAWRTCGLSRALETPR